MFLLFCTSAIVSMTREEGYVWVLGFSFVCVEDCVGWIDFFEGLSFDLAHGLSDQYVGSEGWRQSPVMGGIWHLLGLELRGIS